VFSNAGEQQQQEFHGFPTSSSSDERQTTTAVKPASMTARKMVLEDLQEA
jgi:hypothetical protein